MPTIVYFQIPSDNIERSKVFYNQLFGWKIDKFPESNTPEGMENWTVTTTDDKGNKALGDGMSKRQMPQQQITNFIDVKSVDEYSSKVEKLGGKAVVPKTAVPGTGYYAVCVDTENNSFGIFESNESAK
ncbi:MAG: glyoxalase [Candidatus Nitrosopolaris wilkensis]|nr:MAG: glyoxalase [Candidatus Nitrosopolaris wilkensis]